MRSSFWSGLFSSISHLPEPHVLNCVMSAETSHACAGAGKSSSDAAFIGNDNNQRQMGSFTDRLEGASGRPHPRLRRTFHGSGKDFLPDVGVQPD